MEAASDPPRPPRGAPGGNGNKRRTRTLERGFDPLLTDAPVNSAFNPMALPTSCLFFDAS